MIPLSCPRCRSALSITLPTIHCGGCGARYPVVGGIPDLRTAPDPWIGMADDRAKGLALDASAPPGLEAAVREYWAMTPGTAPADAARHIAHVLDAPARTADWLGHLTPSAEPGEHWLDVGCGTADLAVTAPKGVEVTSLDVAFRWLVVARRRLRESGIDSELLCANAETLPFADGTFDRVIGLGLIEHCTDHVRVLAEIRRVLRPGGLVHLRTANRWTVLPEHHVGLFGASWLPHGLAHRYVRWRRGTGYEHHHLPSARSLAASLHAAGYHKISVEAAVICGPEQDRLPPMLQRATSTYEFLRQVPGLRALIRFVGPLLEARASRPQR